MKHFVRHGQALGHVTSHAFEKDWLVDPMSSAREMSCNQVHRVDKAWVESVGV